MLNDRFSGKKNGDPSRVAFYSTLLNILVAATKGILAYLSGSSALLADMVHGLSDTLASLLVVVGIWLSKKKSEDFPWGLYKVENFVALVSALFIFFAGYEIVHYVFRKKTPLEIAYFYPSVLGLIGMILSIFLFSRYEARKARDLNSPSLLADASHWRSDMASTAIVLFALFGSWMGYPVIDRIAAVVMVAYIAKVGWDILKNSMRTLLDASVDPGTLQQIREVILSFKPVKEIKSIQCRNSGRYIFVHAHLVFGLKKFSPAHHLSEEIEGAVRKAIPPVDRVSIHYEPQEKGYTVYAVPLGDDQRTLSEHFGEAPFFYLIRIGHPGTSVLEKKVLANPHLREEKAKGIKVSEWLLNHDVDVIFTPKPFDGKGPAYVFSSAEVEVRVTDTRTIDEILKNLPAMNSV
jgi:cation diffusion facilitator family transporter